MNVLWLGLSAQKSKEGRSLPPLDSSTQSGALISQIESQCAGFIFQKTNLVSFPPLDSKGKLRYPTYHEMIEHLPHLDQKILEFTPEVIFLLGNRVGKFVISAKNLQSTPILNTEHAFTDNHRIYIQIYHPSYMMIFKRKNLDEYIQNIIALMHKIYRQKEEDGLWYKRSFNQQEDNECSPDS